LATDFDFIETINLELVDGRGFSREYGTDSVNFIFNQKAIELMGYTENPTGRPFGLDDQPEGKIIGVIKNFNSLPLTYEIEPMMILIYPDYFRYILIRIHPDNFQD